MVETGAPDAEAERVGVPAFHAMQEHRAAMRRRVEAEQGVTISHDTGAVARTDPGQALLHGGPARVAAQLAEVAATGVGGVILTFRMGPLGQEETLASLTRFMTEVVPMVQGGAVPRLEPGLAAVA